MDQLKTSLTVHTVHRTNLRCISQNLWPSQDELYLRLYFKGGLNSEGILELVKIGNFLSSITILSKYLIEIHRICLEVILNAIMVQYFLPTLNLRKKKYESW